MAFAVVRPRLKDPYSFHPEDVTDPPRGVIPILKRIGPGLILTASIVGSGELIATTVLGAEAGYTALWVVLISCFVKPAVQSELGRYTIATGQTGLAGFNAVPGPRFKVNWIAWMWAVMVLVTLFQIGAMYAGVAQVLNTVAPGVPVPVWVVVEMFVTLALLLGGGYERIERLATVKVCLFTMLTLLCALILMSKPEYFSWGQVASGLKFDMPGAGLATAVAVFGITGVGAAELFMYPYWCIEKGYARFTGAQEPGPEWRARAQGWVRVMNVDIVASMIIYTIATVAFYLLGAGVLHTRGLVPAAKDTIQVLSNMYTETLGPWALWLFYVGAIATLYGTIFAATAANSRVYADLCRLLGQFESSDYERRLQWRKRFVWGLSVIPVFIFFLFPEPVAMVRIGGIAQALMLPVIAIGALYLRHRRLPAEAAPGVWSTAAVWLASLFTILMMGYYLFLTLRYWIR